MNKLAVVITILLAGTQIGCGDDDGAEPLADLDGQSFVVATAEGVAVVDVAPLTLSFEDGVLVVQGGCNSMRGGYRIVDGVLELETLAATMRACEDQLMVQDAEVSLFLSERPTLEVNGDEMRLESGQQQLMLTRAT